MAQVLSVGIATVDTIVLVENHHDKGNCRSCVDQEEAVS